MIALDAAAEASLALLPEPLRALKLKMLENLAAKKAQQAEQKLAMPAEEPLGMSADESPEVSQEFLMELKAKMVENSNKSGHVCKYGRLCGRVGCRSKHPQGRSIEENPALAICQLGRNCRWKDCYSVHPNGRILDEQIGFCHLGVQCEDPHCNLAHPAGRKRPARLPCNHCGAFGHFKNECPQREGNRVRAAFPEEWQYDGQATLAERLTSYLELHGELLGVPEVSEDCSEAFACFASPAAAKEAVLNLDPTKVPFSLKFSHDKAGVDGMSQFSIHIKNIPTEATETQLHEFCEQVGVVQCCKIIKKENKVYGFCHFYDECTRQAAIEVLNGKEFRGRKLKVQGERYQKEQCALVSGFPKEWYCWDDEELARKVEEITKRFGELDGAPVVSDDGHSVRVQFVGRPLSESKSVILHSGCKVQINPCSAWSKRFSGKVREPAEVRERTVFIGGIHECTKEDVEELCSEVGIVENVRFTWGKKQKDTISRGYGFVRFTSVEEAENAVAKLHGTEYRGNELCVDRRAFTNERASGQSRSRSRIKKKKEELRQKQIEESKKKKQEEAKATKKKQQQEAKQKRRDEISYVRVHIDELEMPFRPDVEPGLTDCEVWVDALPEDETDDWISTFGEVADVYRVHNREIVGAAIGEKLQQGYVKFQEHESARSCVDAGVAVWSESERILKSAHSIVRPGAYPINVIKLLLGNNTDGGRIARVKKDIGLRILFVRWGDTGEQKEDPSSRIHFICKGTPESVSKTKLALEQMLADIHNEVLDFFEDQEQELQQEQPSSGIRVPYLPKPNRPNPKARKGRKARGRKRKRQDESLDPGGPDFPPGQWSAPPVGPSTRLNYGVQCWET